MTIKNKKAFFDPASMIALFLLATSFVSLFVQDSAITGAVTGDVKGEKILQDVVVLYDGKEYQLSDPVILDKSKAKLLFKLDRSAFPEYARSDYVEVRVVANNWIYAPGDQLFHIDSTSSTLETPGIPEKITEGKNKMVVDFEVPARDANGAPIVGLQTISTYTFEFDVVKQSAAQTLPDLTLVYNMYDFNAFKDMQPTLAKTFTVSSKFVDPQQIPENQKFQIFVSVKNNKDMQVYGAQVAGEVTRDPRDGWSKKLEVQNVPTIKPFSAQHPGYIIEELSAGKYIFEGKVTPRCQQGEGEYQTAVACDDANAGDNTLKISFTVVKAALQAPQVDPKQVVEALPTQEFLLQQTPVTQYVTLDTIIANQPATMKVRVKNVYSQPKMLTVRFYVDGKESGEPKFTNTLQPGYQEIVQLSIPALETGKHALQVQADDYPVTFEANIQKPEETITVKSMLSLRAPVEGVFYQNGKAVPQREGYAQITYNGGPAEAKLILQNSNLYPPMSEAVYVLLQSEITDRNAQRGELAVGYVGMNEQKDIVIPLTNLNPGKQILVVDIKETKLGRMTEESRRVTAKFNVIYAECPQGTTREVDDSCVAAPVTPTATPTPVVPVVPVVTKNAKLEADPTKMFIQNKVLSPDALPNTYPNAEFYVSTTSMDNVNYKPMVDILIVDDVGNKINGWKQEASSFGLPQGRYKAFFQMPKFPKDGKYKMSYTLQAVGDEDVSDNKAEFTVTVVGTPQPKTEGNAELLSTILDQAGALIPVEGKGPITFKTTLKNTKIFTFIPTVKYTITDQNKQVVYENKVAFDFLSTDTTKQFSVVGPELKQGNYVLVSELQQPGEEPAGKQEDNKRTLQFSVKPAVGQLPLAALPKIELTNKVEWYQDGKKVNVVTAKKPFEAKLFLYSKESSELPITVYFSDKGTTFNTVPVTVKLQPGTDAITTVKVTDKGLEAGDHPLSIILEGVDSTGKKKFFDTSLYIMLKVKEAELPVTPPTPQPVQPAAPTPSTPTPVAPSPAPQPVQPTFDFALGEGIYYKQKGNTYLAESALDPSSEIVAEVHVILDEDEMLPPAVMKVLVDGKVIQQSFALPQQPQAYKPSGRTYSNVEVPLGKQSSGKHEIEFILDPENKVAEISETNNARKVVFTVKDAEQPDVVLKAIIFGNDNGIVHFQQDRRRPANDLVPAQDTTVQVETWNVGEAAVEKPVVVAKLDGVEIARKEIETLPARQQGTKRTELALGKLPSGTHTLAFELSVANDKHQESNKDSIVIVVQSPSTSTENEHIYFGKELSQAIFDNEKAVREGKNIIELKLHLVNSNDKVIGPVPLIIKFGGETIKRDVMLAGRHNFHTEEFSVDRRDFPTKIVAKMDIKDNSPSDNVMKLPVVLKKDGKMYTLN